MEPSASPSPLDRPERVDPTRRRFLNRGLVAGATVLASPFLSASGSHSAQASTESRKPDASATEGGAPNDTGRGMPRDLEAGLHESRFEIQVEGRTVPGIVWKPESPADGNPLVLAGHGGGFGTAGHKRVPQIIALAKRLARDGISTAAIDQPGCGDRPGAKKEQARRRSLTIEQAIEQLWTRELVESMARDWQASLDRLRSSDGLGEAGVAYWGPSGGTTFGLPLVALESRIRAAVLGLNSDVPLMLGYAPRITCPVLYTMNLDDRFMSRDRCLALFDALPAEDKFVLAYPGDHGQNLGPAVDLWARFFADRMSVLRYEVP